MVDIQKTYEHVSWLSAAKFDTSFKNSVKTSGVNYKIGIKCLAMAGYLIAEQEKNG